MSLVSLKTRSVSALMAGIDRRSNAICRTVGMVVCSFRLFYTTPAKLSAVGPNPCDTSAVMGCLRAGPVHLAPVLDDDTCRANVLGEEARSGLWNRPGGSRSLGHRRVKV
jgi:hypothetical protein